MMSTARRCGLVERALTSSPSASLPSFLVPAFQQCRSTPTTMVRPFSVSIAAQSHIGRAPVSIPPEVSVSILPPTGSDVHAPRDSTVQIEGPLGKLFMKIPPFVTIEQDAERRATVSIKNREEKQQREMWGTTRAYLQNHVLGVSEGHTSILRLVGVGYRSTIEDTATTVEAEFPGQKFVNLKVGYSHPIELPIPKGITASTPQPTRLLLQGADKQALQQFAAKIRKWRVPEPYKGKGIFVNDETIKLKSKKIK